MKKRILMTEEDRLYQKLERNKDRMQESLDRIGYQSAEEYSDYISHYAW